MVANIDASTHKVRRIALIAVVATVALSLWTGSAAASALGQITEFSAGLQGQASYPTRIAAGPDGNLWFTDAGCLSAGSCEIGRITPSGSIKEFSAGLQAGRESNPDVIAPGPQGNMWFTDQGGDGSGIDEIGQITPSGTITESSAGLPAGSGPAGIATGPDGNLWFTDEGTRAIGQLGLRAPAVSTGSASAITAFGASVAGTVNPLGGAVRTISVQYGPTAAYGLTAASTPATLPPGGAPVAVSATISGLAPETVIHYRVVASNGVGIAAGLDQTFTTASVTPRISSARQSNSTWLERDRPGAGARRDARDALLPRPHWGQPGFLPRAHLDLEEAQARSLQAVSPRHAQLHQVGHYKRSRRDTHNCTRSAATPGSSTLAVTTRVA